MYMILCACNIYYCQHNRTEVIANLGRHNSLYCYALLRMFYQLIGDKHSYIDAFHWINNVWKHTYDTHELNACIPQLHLVITHWISIHNMYSTYYYVCDDMVGMCHGASIRIIDRLFNSLLLLCFFFLFCRPIRLT